MIIYCNSDGSLISFIFINMVFLAHMVSGNVFLVKKMCASFYISAITLKQNSIMFD